MGACILGPQRAVVSDGIGTKPCTTSPLAGLGIHKRRILLSSLFTSLSLHQAVSYPSDYHQISPRLKWRSRYRQPLLSAVQLSTHTSFIRPHVTRLFLVVSIARELSRFLPSPTPPPYRPFTTLIHLNHISSIETRPFDLVK